MRKAKHSCQIFATSVAYFRHGRLNNPYLSHCPQSVYSADPCGAVAKCHTNRDAGAVYENTTFGMFLFLRMESINSIQRPSPTKDSFRFSKPSIKIKKTRKEYFCSYGLQIYYQEYSKKMKSVSNVEHVVSYGTVSN